MSLILNDLQKLQEDSESTLGIESAEKTYRGGFAMTRYTRRASSILIGCLSTLCVGLLCVIIILALILSRQHLDQWHQNMEEKAKTLTLEVTAISERLSPDGPLSDDILKILGAVRKLEEGIKKSNIKLSSGIQMVLEEIGNRTDNEQRKNNQHLDQWHQNMEEKAKTLTQGVSAINERLSPDGPLSDDILKILGAVRKLEEGIKKSNIKLSSGIQMVLEEIGNRTDNEQRKNNQHLDQWHQNMEEKAKTLTQEVSAISERLSPEGPLSDDILKILGAVRKLEEGIKKSNTKLSSGIQMVLEEIGNRTDNEQRKNSQHLDQWHQNMEEKAKNLTLEVSAISERLSPDGPLFGDILKILGAVRKLEEGIKNIKLSSGIQRVLEDLSNRTGDVQRKNKLLDLLCSAGWTRHKYSCYVLSSKNQPWNDAKKDCEDLNAQLVVINDEVEMEFLRKFVTINDVWIGLSDVSGDWKWVDGTPLNKTPTTRFFGVRSYEVLVTFFSYCKYPAGAVYGHDEHPHLMNWFWEENQPDDWKAHGLGGGEDCVELRDKNKWNDHHCSQSFKYICEEEL